MKLLKTLPPILLIVIPFFWEAMNIKLIGNEDATLGNLAVTYTCLVFFLIIFILNYKSNNNYFFTRLRPLLIFNIVLVVIYSLQIVFSLSQVLATLSIIKSYLFSLALLLYFSTYSIEKKKIGIKYILLAVVPLFIIQLALSSWESHKGVYIFGDNDWVNQLYIGLKIESRLIFSIVTKNLFIGQYFTLPFSGLLGQWNYWGTQLPIYNLIFWFLFLVYKKKIVALFLILTLISSILNTSRFGLIAIIITDLILYLKFGNKSKWVLAIGMIIFLGIIYINWESISVGWYLYIGGSDTLTTRFNLYNYFSEKLRFMNLQSFIIGVGTKEGSNLAFQISGNNNSFESEFFSKLFLTGIFGFTALIAFLFSFLKYFWKKNVLQKYFGILLLFNIVTVSIISNCIFNVYIFSFVTIIYIVVSNYDVIYTN
ncbi:MAG: hypothetical protein NTX65_03425 [Ignavibacteriales bacterium]|nr:hypothetical protein [Ignavibacteriales bacterium]